MQAKEHTLISDAKCTVQGNWYYIEVDNTQHMRENKKKIETYALLKRLKEFTLIFYTSSEVRKKRLEEWCKEYNLKAQIYTKKDII